MTDKIKNNKAKIPRTPTVDVDWEVIAKSRNGFGGSASGMFHKLFPKMTNKEMSIHLGVDVRTLVKGLKQYGLCDIVKRNRGKRIKHSFPYRILGFETDKAMWVSFVENRFTPLQIQKAFFDIAGKVFAHRVIESNLTLERKKYKQGKENA